MKVQCENCEVSYDQKPRQAAKKGAFRLCYYCRRNPPSNYICKAKTATGDDCKRIKMFNSEYCGTHKDEWRRVHGKNN